MKKFLIPNVLDCKKDRELSFGLSDWTRVSKVNEMLQFPFESFLLPTLTLVSAQMNQSVVKSHLIGPMFVLLSGAVNCLSLCDP